MQTEEQREKKNGEKWTESQRNAEHYVDRHMQDGNNRRNGESKKPQIEEMCAVSSVGSGALIAMCLSSL